MPKNIVCDTSCLILFYKLDQLELLRKLFGRILLTDIIQSELKHPIPDWIEVVNPKTEITDKLTEIE